jgi:hypothetical protein
LNRVQLAALGQTFDGGNLRALRLDREQHAGLDAAAVQKDRAGATVARVAADVGAGQPGQIADVVDEE